MKTSQASTLKAVCNFRYKTPQWHWLEFASGVLFGGGVLVVPLWGVAMLFLQFFQPELAPDPDTWAGPIIGSMIFGLFAGPTCMVVGEASFMGALSIASRYVICNGNIVYYRNVSEVVLERGKCLRLQTRTGRRLVIQKSRFFVLGRQADQKAAERFETATDLICGYVKVLSPAAHREVKGAQAESRDIPPVVRARRQLSANARKAATRKTKR